MSAEDTTTHALYDGRYRLSDKPIGEGGMGKIFRAYDTKLGRDVAVKVLHEEYASSPEAVHRFIGEARAAAKSHHENIVQVLEYGHVGNQYYIVLELLKGSCLADVKIGTLTDAQVADVFLQICDGLESAHENGIVHRDLKPENVFLVPLRSGRVRVKLLDFGVALIRDASGSSDTSRRFTKEGTTLGTPHYMALEQLAGRIDEIDVRTDIYAVGVMLYEALTGTLPFDGESYEAICYARMSAEEPPRHPKMSERLWPIVKKAMAKKREDRYASVAALREALERLGHRRSQAVIDVLPALLASELPANDPSVNAATSTTPAPLRKTELVWSQNEKRRTRRIPSRLVYAAIVVAVIGIALPFLILGTRAHHHIVSATNAHSIATTTPLVVTPTRLVVPSLPTPPLIETPIVPTIENVPVRTTPIVRPHHTRPQTQQTDLRRCINRNATPTNCVIID